MERLGQFEQIPALFADRGRCPFTLNKTVDVFLGDQFEGGARSPLCCDLVELLLNGRINTLDQQAPRLFTFASRGSNADVSIPPVGQHLLFVHEPEAFLPQLGAVWFDQQMQSATI